MGTLELDDIEERRSSRKSGIVSLYFRESDKWRRCLTTNLLQC